MEEKDLEKIWQKTDENAQNYFDSVSDDLVEKAQKKSHDVLERVRKNIVIELWASAICTVSFPFFFLNNIRLMIVATVLMISAMIATWVVYSGYLKKIKAISNDDIITTLKAKISVLGGWIRRLKLLVYIFAIPAFFFGTYLGYRKGNPGTNFQLPETDELIFSLAFYLLFMLLFFWGVNRYLYLLYGRNLSKLKSILAGLENQE